MSLPLRTYLQILTVTKSRSCLQRRILSDVNMDPIHLVIDQRLRLDSILVLHSGWSMNGPTLCNMYIIANRVLSRNTRSIHTPYLFCCRQSWVGLFWLNLPDKPRRISSDASEVGNVLRYNTSCTNSHTSPNGNPWKHYHITTKPAVFTNRNRLAEFRTLDTITQERI